MKNLLHTIRVESDFDRVDASIKNLWQCYLDHSDDKSSQDTILIWRSGPSVQLSRSYIDRILKGELCVIPSLYWSYQLNGLPTPKKGDKSILINWTGHATAIVESSTVEVCSLSDIGGFFERQNDLNKENIDELRERLTQEAKSFRFQIEPSMPIVMETVQVKYSNHFHCVPENNLRKSMA